MVVDKAIRIATLALLVGLVAACAGRAVYHRVKPGETLSAIGEAYGVPYREIARANGVRDPARIYAGQRLRIPGAEREIERSLARQRRTTSRQLPAGSPSMRWPLAGGTVTSLFGPRGRRFHDGIDIAAPIGAAVRAAASGEVVYNGVLSGYGNVIIIKHTSGYSTVYAHNHRHFVKKGQRVRRGERIAAVGETGRATGPNLHFEVRYRNVARDPMIFLPPRGRADSGS